MNRTHFTFILIFLLLTSIITDVQSQGDGSDGDQIKEKTTNSPKITTWCPGKSCIRGNKHGGKHNNGKGRNKKKLDNFSKL